MFNECHIVDPWESVIFGIISLLIFGNCTKYTSKYTSKVSEVSVHKNKH